MVGVVGQQLGYLQLRNYLDPRTFLHLISRSPNTETTSAAHHPGAPTGPQTPHPHVESTLESQDFGWVTGMEKQAESTRLRRRSGWIRNRQATDQTSLLPVTPVDIHFFRPLRRCDRRVAPVEPVRPGEVLCLYNP